MRLDTLRHARTVPPLPRMFRPVALAVLPLAMLALAGSPAQAQREDQGLQLGCANDYFRLCAGVDPNSPEAEKCMTRNRKRLSPECRAAIGDYDKRTGGKSMPED